jgi:hypothetical protein
MRATGSAAFQQDAFGPPPADDGFAVRRSAGGLYELSIGGRFHPGWGGSLANGLAQHGVSIVRGFARKTEALRWRARFELEPTAGGDNPLALDYLDLASRPLPSRRPAEVSLDRYVLCSSAAHGGSVEVGVEGPDQVGFLGALLKRFAFLALFPEEMSVDTREGRVHDVFWLKGIGRTIPSDEARGGLGRILRRLSAREKTFSLDA